MKMTGGFGRLQDYEKIKAAGFDFAELDIPQIEELPEEEFQEFLALVKRTGFPVLTGARALPIADPWFFTDDYRPEEWYGYLEKACARCAQLGMKKLIIGNGKARSLIDESSITKEERFFDFMRRFCDIAEKNSLEVILEPLGPKYSNYLNTLPQAVEAVQKIGRPNLFIMADMRHMVWNREPFGDIKECIGYVHHIHIDYPLSWPERPFPAPEDDYDYDPFFKALRESGYQGTLTIESDFPEDWEAAFERSKPIVDKYYE